jgi:hypothetical protein
MAAVTPIMRTEREISKMEDRTGNRVDDDRPKRQVTLTLQGYFNSLRYHVVAGA